MFFIYNIWLVLLWPFAAVYMLWRHYRLKKSAAPWWGRVPVEVSHALKNTSPRFWLHAVSVGEVMAARPVARALKSTFPGCGIVVSTTTDTGQNAARQAMERGEFDAAFYYPLDFAWTVQRALGRVRPDAVLLMETELWPNFLHFARRRGSAVFLVNGRVSDNLLRQSKRLRPLWKWMTTNVTAFFVRSDFDAKRLEELGVPPSKVLLTGDVKLDGINPNFNAAEGRGRIRELLGIGETELLWIAGSTHEGEEVLLLEAQRALQPRLDHPLRLMLAPRHPERVEAVMQLARDKGFTAVRRSQLPDVNIANNPIIILDTVGELAEFYAAADVAFVGGSLIQRGGHNVLEPALAGVPVLFGPHMNNFRAAAQLVQDGKVGQMVHSPAELIQALEDWLGDSSKRATLIDDAAKLLAQHQGAARRVAEEMVNYELRITNYE